MEKRFESKVWSGDNYDEMAEFAKSHDYTIEKTKDGNLYLTQGEWRCVSVLEGNSLVWNSLWDRFETWRKPIDEKGVSDAKANRNEQRRLC